MCPITIEYPDENILPNRLVAEDLVYSAGDLALIDGFYGIINDDVDATGVAAGVPVSLLINRIARVPRLTGVGTALSQGDVLQAKPPGATGSYVVEVTEAGATEMAIALEDTTDDDTTVLVRLLMPCYCVTPA